MANLKSLSKCRKAREFGLLFGCYLPRILTVVGLLTVKLTLLSGLANYRLPSMDLSVTEAHGRETNLKLYPIH